LGILSVVRKSNQHSAIKNKSKNNEGFFKAFFYILLLKTIYRKPIIIR